MDPFGRNVKSLKRVSRACLEACNGLAGLEMRV